MIIYGSRSAALSSDTPEKLICPNCQTEGSTRIHVFGRYAHIFWIPLFPVGRPAVAECSHCQAAYDKKEMTAEMRQAADALSSSTKTPIWFFSGLAVIAVLAGVIFYTGQVNSENNKRYIEEPMAGDKYDYKSGDGMYSTLLVDRVDSDSVYVFENTMQVDKRSQLRKIDKPEYYPETTYGVSRQDVKDLFQDGTIFDIDRDE
ncbi:zinc-ribbon domain-containing protein [bacterium SCSIO 12741]|nr:zinc-ribbon domain-containing protein [bacterium SCSIO 12741]